MALKKKIKYTRRYPYNILHRGGTFTIHDIYPENICVDTVFLLIVIYL